MTTKVPHSSAAIDKLAAVIDRRIEERLEARLSQKMQAFVNNASKSTDWLQREVGELRLSSMVLKEGVATAQREIVRLEKRLRALEVGIETR